MTRILVCLLITCNSLLLDAQRPWDLLEQWSARQPIQKIHLHLDRENYIAGETAWFKAYLVSDYTPDTISSTLYVELLGRDSSILCRKILPILLGSSSGQLEIPDSLVSGTYTIRAYTRTMKDLFPDFVYRKALPVFGKKPTAGTDLGKKVRVHFFPEGGNLVAGLPNNVAFKADYENGYPASFNGDIRDSKGNLVTTVSDYHDGMGMFEINPVAGEKYYALSGTEKFFLPDPMAMGITVNLIPQDHGFFYEIQQQGGDPKFTAAWLVGQMQHHIVFKQELKPGQASQQGTVNTASLHSGIIQVSIFNKDGMPLAERLLFNNNREYLQPTEILADTVDFKPGGRNRFRIALKDTVEGNISVSVVDADYEIDGIRTENIFTDLLLTSDLRGYVHDPYYYFSSDNDSVKTATDLLMMTHGWRRFSWTELPAAMNRKTINPAFITLEGKAVLRNTNRAFDDKSLLLMINNVKGVKKRSTHFIQTDREGNFKVDSLLFFDRNLLLFCDIRGKKSQYIDIKMRGDSLHRPFPWSRFEKIPDRPVTGSDRWQMDQDAILRENGLMLEGITIKVKNKTPMEVVDEKYTSALFSGDASRSIDLVNSDDAASYANIFDYLQFRVNGLQITNDGADYIVEYRQTAVASSLGNIPMTIYLDEVETDASLLATVPAYQVALVKIYSNFVGTTGNGAGGVLAVYTKKGEDLIRTGGGNNIVVYNGYSVVREFYAPDYKTPLSKPDNRITLDWRPAIFINNINPKIPVSFYNSSRTRHYKIIVEGMNSNGKMIWAEKTITGK